MRSKILWRTATALLALLATPSRADVIVVDAGGGGDFTQLPDAIAAALDGDVLLVRTGAYSAYLGFAAPDKSLTLVADAPSPPLLLDFMFHDLPAGRTVVVRGFDLRTKWDFGYSVDLVDCAGALVFEDCKIVAANIGPAGFTGSPPGWPGAHVVGCDSVTFVRSSFLGGLGAAQSIGGPTSTWGPGSGGPALDASTSHVALHGCTLLGGKGGFGSYIVGTNGGPGLQLAASTALFSGCIAQGGQGGTACDSAQLPEWCNGGPGILLDATSTLQVLDGSWTGGIAGSSSSGEPGLVGPPFVGPPGQPIVFDGTARALEVTSPLREQQLGLLELDGVDGDVVFFVMSFQANSLPLPGKKGWLGLALPILGPFALGVIADPIGHADISFMAPDLTPATLEGQTFLLQGVFVPPGGKAVLGSVGSFTLVDSAF